MLSKGATNHNHIHLLLLQSVFPEPPSRKKFKEPKDAIMHMPVQSDAGLSAVQEQALAAFLAVKQIIRRAILTLAAIQDPDQRYRRGFTSWSLPVVREASEAYGYSSASAARFIPSPQDISQMEVVAGWLAWLRRKEGEGALQRIIAWSRGVPGWSIGMRERCSERTVKNRIDRSVAAIIREFSGAELSVEIVEETLPAPEQMTSRQGRAIGPFSMVVEKIPGPHGERVTLKKVYVHDIGFVIGARRLRDGRERAERLMA